MYIYMTLAGELLTIQALLLYSMSASLTEYLLQQNNFLGPLFKKKKCQVSLKGGEESRLLQWMRHLPHLFWENSKQKSEPYYVLVPNQSPHS